MMMTEYINSLFDKDDLKNLKTMAELISPRGVTENDMLMAIQSRLSWCAEMNLVPPPPSYDYYGDGDHCGDSSTRIATTAMEPFPTNSSMMMDPNIPWSRNNCIIHYDTMQRLPFDDSFGGNDRGGCCLPRTKNHSRGPCQTRRDHYSRSVSKVGPCCYKSDHPLDSYQESYDIECFETSLRRLEDPHPVCNDATTEEKANKFSIAKTIRPGKTQDDKIFIRKGQRRREVNMSGRNKKKVLNINLEGSSFKKFDIMLEPLVGTGGIFSQQTCHGHMSSSGGYDKKVLDEALLFERADAAIETRLLSPGVKNSQDETKKQKLKAVPSSQEQRQLLEGIHRVIDRFDIQAKQLKEQQHNAREALVDIRRFVRTSITSLTL